MARREDDSYTNGSVFEVSVEEGRKDKSEAFADVVDEHPPEADEADDADGLGVCAMLSSVPFIQQLIAEFLATFFLIFAGCGVITVNQKNGMATFPGIAVVWGMTVMAMIHAVGHVSGAHINPAVTVGFAVPAYVVVQMVAAIIASLMLRLMFGRSNEVASVTAPTGSNVQSLVLEFIVTFYLMPVSGASMNPARSIGPAMVGNKYTSLWVYILGPFAGAAAGAWAYNLLRPTDRTLGEITNSARRNN
nr:unnamed protein product [Digitaria exilis]